MEGECCLWQDSQSQARRRRKSLRWCLLSMPVKRPQHSGGGRPDLTAPACAFQTPSHVNPSPRTPLILRCTVLPGALNRLHRKLPLVPGTDWL